jgi:predicted AAA+ superfamily ATPase
MIPRTLTENIQKYLFKGKAVIITGPRQSGKTTLVRNIVQSLEKKHIWINGDESDIRELFSRATSTTIKNIIGNAEIVVFDEAQRIQNIGLCLKLIVDQFPSKQVIATGSSSFELSNHINEPLTGRKWEYTLLPFSFEELSDHTSILEERRLLNQRLIYGSYPEIVSNTEDIEKRLQLLTDSYLYKDILIWERINKPQCLEKLVQALALQVGNEVSYKELGDMAGLDNQTVEKYITLLEKSYILFRLPAFSRNLRNELKKSRKVYFFDNGIRNALIKNFNIPSLRTDTGALWENYLIAERFKFLHYHDQAANRYFWRTIQQQEIDYIEEYAGILHTYEFKWNSNKKYKVPRTFVEAYKDSVSTVISNENYDNFLMGQ